MCNLDVNCYSAEFRVQKMKRHLPTLNVNIF
jgi:hypothetical protein